MAPVDGMEALGTLLRFAGGALDEEAWPVALLADPPRTSDMKAGPDIRLAEPAKAGTFAG